MDKKQMFNQSFETFYTKVYRKVLELTGSHDMAEEVTQDVFLKLTSELEDMQKWQDLKAVGRHLLVTGCSQTLERLRNSEENWNAMLKIVPERAVSAEDAGKRAEILPQLWDYVLSWEDESKYLYIQLLLGTSKEELEQELGITAQEVEDRQQELRGRLEKRFVEN